MCGCPELDCNCPEPCTDCIAPDTMIVRNIAKPSLCEDIIDLIGGGNEGPGCEIKMGGAIISGTTITLTVVGSNGAVEFSRDGVSWQDSPTFSNQPAGPRKYFAREKRNNACVAAAYTTVPGCVTPAPAVVSPVNYVVGQSAQPLSATGTALKWYTSASGGTASSLVPVPITTATGTTTYYVSQTLNGCEGPRAAIQVIVSGSGCVPGPVVDVTPQQTQCVGGFIQIRTTDGCTQAWRTTTTTCGTPGTCVIPSGPVFVQTVSSTCSQAGQFLNNGRFEYGPVTGGDRYALWLPTSGLPRPTYNDSTLIPAGGYIVVTGVPGSDTDKSYRLIIFNQTTECYLEKIANFAYTICDTTCVQPFFQFDKVDPTCSGEASVSNGQLKMTNVANGTRYQVCVGATFSCPSNYDTATPITSPASTNIVNNVGFAQGEAYRDYTIRVFNGSPNCFTTLSYRFNNPCYISACVTPTSGNNVITQATCAGVNVVNNDAAVNIPAVVNGTKYGYSSGTVYSGPDYTSASNISGGQINITSLTGSANTTSYVVRIFNGRSDCYVDRAVTIPGKNCQASCVNPAFTIGVLNPTCNSGVSNQNGNVNINNVANGNRWQLCAGASFTCTPNYETATPFTGVGPIMVIPNHGFAGEEFKDYTIRVFNNSQNCFTDHSVRVTNPCYNNTCCNLVINNIQLTNV